VSIFHIFDIAIAVNTKGVERVFRILIDDGLRKYFATIHLFGWLAEDETLSRHGALDALHIHRSHPFKPIEFRFALLIYF
jgi:hypothetical protein